MLLQDLRLKVRSLPFSSVIDRTEVIDVERAGCSEYSILTNKTLDDICYRAGLSLSQALCTSLVEQNITEAAANANIIFSAENAAVKDSTVI